MSLLPTISGDSRMADLEGQDCGGWKGSGSTATTLGGENVGDQPLFLSGSTSELTSMKRRQASGTQSRSSASIVMKKQKATCVASASNVIARAVGDNEENIELSGTKGIRNKVSEVWKDFTKEKGEDGRELARCHHCNNTFVGSSKSGTTHLKNHLKRCAGKRNTDGEPESGNAGASNVIGENFTFDQLRSRQDLVKMIINDGYPLNMFESESTKNFLNYLQPAFKVPSQEMVRADIFSLYKHEREKVRTALINLSSRIHLVIDVDMPEHGKHFYFSLKSRFINNDWKLKENFLGFRKSQGDAEALFETFKSLISEWHIENKIGFITVRSKPGIPTSKFTSLLSERLSIPCSNMDDSYMLREHIGEVLSGMKDILHKMQQSIQYANENPHRRRTFLNAARWAKFQMEELSASVPKVSDDQFLTLEGALQARKVFEVLEEIDPQFDVYPSVTEREKASKRYEYLKGIKDAMLSSAAGTNVIADTYYFKLLAIDEDSSVWDEMELSRMKNKFASYLMSQESFQFAAFLDPRFKRSILKGLCKDFYGPELGDFEIRHIFASLDQLFSQYKSVSGQVIPSAFVSGDAPPDPELCRYKNESNLLESAGLGILDWWRDNTPRFPTLARMARDYLPILMSTHSSDSGISAKVMRIRQVFNDPDPEMLEALICTKDWLENA